MYMYREVSKVPEIIERRVEQKKQVFKVVERRAPTAVSDTHRRVLTLEDLKSTQIVQERILETLHNFSQIP